MSLLRFSEPRFRHRGHLFWKLQAGIHVQIGCVAVDVMYEELDERHNNLRLWRDSASARRCPIQVVRCVEDDLLKKFLVYALLRRQDQSSSKSIKSTAARRDDEYAVATLELAGTDPAWRLFP